MTTYNYPNDPNVRSEDWLKRQPLKLPTGNEVADTIIALASVVTVDSSLRRLIPGGTVMNKITSGHGIELYGPYSKTASDGRQTLTAGLSLIATTGVEVTLGNKPMAGYLSFAILDPDYIQDSEAAGDAISKHGASYTALKAAFPTCVFRDA